MNLTRREFLNLIVGGSIAVAFSGSMPRILPGRDVVRPPGAITEDAFNSFCIRCGKCVAACPTHALVFADIFDGWHKVGTPKVDALKGPCEAVKGRCEGNLRCVSQCPTSALRNVKTEDVKIGTALIDRTRCLAWLDKSCLVCFEVCPIFGAVTLTEDGKPILNAGICIGCGRCVYACPADPKALALTPDGERRI